MSKKTLLEESTVRKFMKFANIGHLAENYLDEAGMYEEEEEAMDFAPAVADEEPAAEEEEVMEMAHPEGEMEEGAYMEEDEHMEEGMHDKEVVEVVDEESVVAETVKRVTARLKSMNKASRTEKSREAMVESVVERIMKKISNK